MGAAVTIVTLVVAAALALGLWALLWLGSFDGGSPGGEAGTTSSPNAAAGNGGFTTSTAAGGQTELLLHPIGSDGTIGEAQLVYRGPDGGSTGPGVIDALGSAVLIGWALDGPSTVLQVRSAGDAGLVHELQAPGWCSVYADGPDFGLCLLLDEDRFVQVDTIGEGFARETTLQIRSLDSGDLLGRYGPFAAPQQVLATPSPDTILMVRAEDTGGRIFAMDLATGDTTLIGPYEQGWRAVCALGTDAVLGVQMGDSVHSLSGVGAAVASLTWPAEGPWGFEIRGCSADHRFAYLVASLGPPDAAGRMRTLIDRISLADGARVRVFDAEIENWNAWTR